jgi:hypothetical protein
LGPGLILPSACHFHPDITVRSKKIEKEVHNARPVTCRAIPADQAMEVASILALKDWPVSRWQYSKARQTEEDRQKQAAEPKGGSIPAIGAPAG